MRIDIVIPTHNRKSKLSRCINSILASNYQDYRIIVVNDHDDKFAFGIWNEYLLDSMPDYSEEAEQQAMFYLCDDTELDPNCLTELAMAMAMFDDTDAVVGVNQVNIPDGSQSAMGLIGRKFAQRYRARECFCPDYHSFWADTELREHAIMLGKFKWCESAKLHHHHPAHEPKERDETHQLVRRWTSVDKETRAARQADHLLWGLHYTYHLINRRDRTE